MRITPYSDSSWRNTAAPIISRVLEETKGQPDCVVRKALHDAYPFGIRKHHPYKIWLDEIKKQREGGAVQFAEIPEKLVFPDAPIGGKA